MNFFQVESLEEFAEGSFHVMEPVSHKLMTAEKPLILTPGLVFDEQKNRMGYGKGYYDRFLARFEGVSVIVCYADFRMPVPSEPHDKKAELTIFDAEVNHG